MLLLLIGLLIYTISTYGTAWIVTESALFHPLRAGLTKLAEATKGKFLIQHIASHIAYLFSCIVCMGTCVGIAFVLLAEQSAILSQSLPPVISIFDVVVWAGWSAATTWMLASKFDPE